MFKQNVPRFLFRALIPAGLHCRELKTADVELRGLNKIAAKPKAAKFVKQKFGSRVENAILVEQSIIANRDPRTQSIVNSATINARIVRHLILSKSSSAKLIEKFSDKEMKIAQRDNNSVINS